MYYEYNDTLMRIFKLSQNNLYCIFDNVYTINENKPFNRHKRITAKVQTC